MNIKVTNVRELTGVRHCLREKDKESMIDILAEMNDNTSEENLTRLARTMLNTGVRNQHIDSNERNIGMVIDIIKENTEQGDMITANSCMAIVRECRLDRGAATVNAVYEALEQLVKTNYLNEKRMAKTTTDGWGRTRYIKVYEVR